MGEGLQRAFAVVAATNLTAEQIKFLRTLASWEGIASPQDLGPQTKQEENSARQRCKRQKLVIYEDGYWKMTNLGREVLRRS